MCDVCLWCVSVMCVCGVCVSVVLCVFVFMDECTFLYISKLCEWQRVYFKIIFCSKRQDTESSVTVTCVCISGGGNVSYFALHFRAQRKNREGRK